MRLVSRGCRGVTSLPCTAAESGLAAQRERLAHLGSSRRAPTQRVPLRCARRDVWLPRAIKLLQLATCKTLASMVSRIDLIPAPARVRGRVPVCETHSCGSARKCSISWPHTLPIPSCARRRKRIARNHTFDIRACPFVAEGLPFLAPAVDPISLPSTS